MNWYRLDAPLDRGETVTSGWGGEIELRYDDPPNS